MHKALTATLLASFLLVASAAAQEGPAPGYDSAVEYAADYAQSESDSAAADPADYAQSHASQEAVVEEVSHTAYIACWAADDAGIESEVCEPFYIPRGEAGPEHKHEDAPLQNDTEEAVDEIENATVEYVEEVEDIVEDTVEDPTTIVDQLFRLRDATISFAQKVLGAVLGFGEAAASFALESVQSLVASVQSIGEGLGDASDTGIEQLDDAKDQALSAASDAADGVAGALDEAASAAGDAASIASDAVDGAQASIFGALGASLQESASQFTAVVASVYEAISDAAESLREAVASLFDDAGAQRSPGLGGVEAVDDATGLVDGVLDILE